MRKTLRIAHRGLPQQESKGFLYFPNRTRKIDMTSVEKRIILILLSCSSTVHHFQRHWMYREFFEWLPFVAERVLHPGSQLHM